MKGSSSPVNNLKVILVAGDGRCRSISHGIGITAGIVHTVRIRLTPYMISQFQRVDTVPSCLFAEFETVPIAAIGELSWVREIYRTKVLDEAPGLCIKSQKTMSGHFRAIQKASIRFDSGICFARVLGLQGAKGHCVQQTHVIIFEI
jgi:hypothetical protein